MPLINISFEKVVQSDLHRVIYLIQFEIKRIFSIIPVDTYLVEVYKKAMQLHLK